MRDKILIIESNKPLACLWQAYLARHGFDAACAIEGESKDHLSSWGYPDVIVSGLDFVKHIPSGADYCIRSLGSKPLHGNLIPVIQLSSAPLAKSVRSALEGSAFKLIEKPLSLQTLLDSVRDAAFEALAASLRRAGSASMSAGLQGHALFGILQSIDAAKRSGTAIVESPNGKAFIRFRMAAFVDARCGALSGPEAVLEALFWSEGSASFHEGEIAPSDEQKDPWPSIQTLTGEALRQHEIIERASKLLAMPSATLQRNPSAKIGGKAPFSEKIFIALEKPCEFEALAERMKNLSRRQLLVSIAGMLERGELVLSSNSSPEKLNSQERKAFIEALEDKDRRKEAISLPPAIAVASPTPRLAKRFIGAACGAPFASYALVGAGRLRLLLYECEADQLQPEALPAGGALLLFDRLDADAIGKFRDLAKRILAEDSSLALIGSASAPDQQRTTTSTAELLGLPDESLICNFEFSGESCANLVAELLKRNLKKPDAFSSLSI